jgi:hypothetical protein
MQELTAQPLSPFLAPTCFPSLAHGGTDDAAMAGNDDDGHAPATTCRFYCWMHVNHDCKCHFGRKRLRVRFSPTDWQQLTHAVSCHETASLRSLLPTYFVSPSFASTMVKKREASMASRMGSISTQGASSFIVLVCTMRPHRVTIVCALCVVCV